MQTVQDVLQKSLEIMGENGQHWTRGGFAKDKDGVDIDPLHDDAVCFCSAGAIVRVTGGWDSPLALDAFDALAGVARASIVTWNDYHVHSFSDVRAAFQMAENTQ